jgi:hypothetical protein
MLLRSRPSRLLSAYTPCRHQLSRINSTRPGTRASKTVQLQGAKTVAGQPEPEPAKKSSCC